MQRFSRFGARFSRNFKPMNLMAKRNVSGAELGAVVVSQGPGALIGMGLGALAMYLLYPQAGPVDYKQVRQDIADILEDFDYDDGSYGPVLFRLAWHSSGTFDKSSGTGGSNGATMRHAPEANDGANNGLDVARAKLEKIKKKYPALSYADLWILASYVALEEMGGPKIEFRPGRVDKSVESCPPNGRLPDASKGSDHIRDIFYRMGFNDQEIVALVGAGHALGRCHLDRSGFDGPWTRAPTTFSNEYFRLLFEDKWYPKKMSSGETQFENENGKDLMMLPTDMEMIKDAKFRKYSEIYYRDADRLKEDFAKAYKKLTELGMDV